MDIKFYTEKLAREARESQKFLRRVTTDIKNRVLLRTAELLIEKKEIIKEANDKDLEFAQKKGYSKALLDRLTLNEKRINGMVQVLKDVASLPDPVGEIISMWTRPNGLRVGQMRVPLGTVMIIYEARPNVTVEAASLCIKSSNAVILKGGSETINSNRVLVEILRQAARESGFPERAIQFVDTTDREAVNHLLTLDQYIDVVIPRGGEGLIRAVAEKATMPVIKHYKGVCNLYIDDEADMEKALNIAYNAKVERPSVCNAIENLIVHKDIAEKFLPEIAYYYGKAGVEMRCDERALEILRDHPKANDTEIVPAKEDDYYEEFLDLIIAVKVVDSIDQAIDFIHKYGSNHSESIVTENYTKGMRFINEVDSSAVYINASTRFTDGNEFGLGAEMGISTDKIHVRGPMGLKELTIPKFIIFGDGQIRNNVGIPEDEEIKIDTEKCEM
ncbi:MAG TPA: gamma-glutamyl-phosphate reductase [Persephonella sp.]|uniref:Gamma-glutamyl phosphate reductase n=1 Tax=Persephonella marina (strain DSM 14350 / EX-H1) TaxID=123214 RepID=PROA_PERMH|nr:MULTISPECIES: glutamate-5-semialdehyde dehydrogenase [Persephonella]C0QS00.1 RecName: Full=Gamma-glutamyl phosphate reductase; Short=GPR; AltName: Full=Glutamate-5-semialdehyde dehydrogenase; AltName: Full=Glutamyl-gamma-semialdehyde dehydrogenase; Short=GSA dehydrogenase [Persephonella marina EX-H1]ACO04323.1 glutamate-5-semialdehyde dehydrogenase [Persephonella marina EX-H1]HCB69191.1 gamma-glutamyl-phosphate reductase [Persephonella sp.]